MAKHKHRIKKGKQSSHGSHTTGQATGKVKDRGMLTGTKMGSTGDKVDFANTKPRTFPDDRHNQNVEKF